MSKNGPRLPTDANGIPIQIAFHPGGAFVAGPFSQASVQGSTIPLANAILRLTATQPCFYKLVQSSGNATTSDHYLAANVPTDVILRNGENRVAVIGASSVSGTLYITTRT